MNNVTLALDGAWKVLVASLIFGAGLPLIFAAGVRSMAVGVGGSAEVDHADPKPLGKVLAGVCFVVVLLGVFLGVSIVVAAGFGKAVSFQHIYPTFVAK